MSSAKSRNFRRRAGDDEDENDNNFATPSSTNKPSAINKPKKPIPQPPKTLLSFADDEDESPFSRPPPSIKSTSAHKLSLSKDRITPHHPSSSNVQPQAGVYTKEALLELHKNTKKTPVAFARNKPKADDEIKLGHEDNEEMTDQATIEKIKAERERLRLAKSVGYLCDYHGEADCLSDEEPQFRGRVAFCGEKIGGLFM
ncbi:hypothetical protein CASFOL_031142 [Castilleja foliolosa]|uniref:Uncharacterized protein n=1 Tax=Castilleja foliolosa TaxID=1961234 RepID=A0ABD3C5A0_9LAMI